MARRLSATIGNYLSAGDVPATDITGTVITVSAWVRPNNFAADHFAVSKATATRTQYQLLINDADNSVHFRVGDSSSSNLANSDITTANVWQHIAGRKDGTGVSALTAWLNGTSGPAVSSPLTIGHQAAAMLIGTNTVSNGSGSSVSLAEIAIWDAALTDSEIQALATGVIALSIRTANLKGYWPLCGLVANEPDLSGNGNVAIPQTVIPPFAHPFTNPYCDPQRTANPAAHSLGGASAW